MNHALTFWKVSPVQAMFVMAACHLAPLMHPHFIQVVARVTKFLPSRCHSQRIPSKLGMGK